jgi:hypothetical protein
MVHPDSKLRTLLMMAALSAGVGGALSACDRSWDFECTGTWADGPMEIKRKVYTYPKMTDENAATQRCKKEMLDETPRKASSAKCECVGK